MIYFNKFIDIYTNRQDKKINFINIIFQKNCLIPFFIIFTKTMKEYINCYIIFIERELSL